MGILKFIRNLLAVSGVIVFISCMSSANGFSERFIYALCCVAMFVIPIKLLNKAINKISGQPHTRDIEYTDKGDEYDECDESISEQAFQRDDELRSEIVKCSKCGEYGLAYKGRRTKCESCGTALRYPR